VDPPPGATFFLSLIEDHPSMARKLLLEMINRFRALEEVPPALAAGQGEEQQEDRGRRMG
jgi:hypothetical protein